MDGIADFIRLLQEMWHKKSVLILILLLLPFLLFWLICDFDFSTKNLLKIMLIIVFITTVLIIWVFTNRLPRALNNRIGILIAIKCENNEQYNTIKSKFVDTFSELINKHESSSLFQLIHLQEHFSHLIERDNISELLSRTNCKFCIFGRCCSGKIDSQETYSISLDGAVVHKPIPTEENKKFAEEFRELLQSKVIIPKDNDLLLFEFHSEQLELVSKYILGIAAYLSEDFLLSKMLFEELYNEVKTIKLNIPVINKIKSKLPTRLFEVYHALSYVEYMKFRKIKRETTYLLEMKKYLGLMNKMLPDSYDYFLMMAIYHFLNGRNVKKVKECLLECKRRYLSHTEWRYSDAFISVYEGNLKSAYRKYKTAFNYGCDHSLYYDIEDFIINIIKEEPENFKLYFALSLINAFCKNDLQLAIDDFNKFIECTRGSYIEEINMLRESLLNSCKTDIPGLTIEESAITKLLQ